MRHYVFAWKQNLIQALLLLGLVGALSMQALAAERYSADDLLSMNVEELVNVKVTTLSKREETYMSTAGAVFVITNDDIRRSGVRSIPDALRLAPGLQVSQTNANQFQIGIRGQTDFWTDLLLVMVDGRPIYNTTFSGIWWVAQNYPLEDIERIEVVRGPGGVIWGSNATNGVINIITKQAGASKGIRISGGAGTEEKGFGNISIASNIGDLDFRVYGMQENRHGGLAGSNIGANLTFPPFNGPPFSGYAVGDETPDFRRMKQQGFRLDWGADSDTHFSMHGDTYQMRAGQLGYWLPTPGTGFHWNYAGVNGFSGRNLVTRLEHELSPHIKLKGQLFYDQYKVHTQFIREKKETYDGDFQVDFRNVMHQNISLGTNLRWYRSHFDNTPQFQMPSRTTSMKSFFINDELVLLDGLLRVIGGVKVERNSYTGWEYQPSARIVASDDDWAVWVAASKSVRTPNDIENGLTWNRKGSGWCSAFPDICMVTQTGDGRAQSEDVYTYEIGGRLRPTKNSLIEVAAFKTKYKGVLDWWQDKTNWANNVANKQTIEYLTNVLNGDADGVEANFRYQPWQWMTLKGSYTYLHQYYDDSPIKDGGTIWTVRSNGGQDPRNRFHMGVSLNPHETLELDANLYYTGSFREGDILTNHRLDVRIGWKPVDALEISAVGQDLFKYQHQENTNNSMEYSSMIQQRYYLMATYTYN